MAGWLPRKQLTNAGSYDNDSRLTQQQLANAVTVSQIYHAATNLTRRAHSGTGGVISQFNYTYNAANLRTKVKEADGGITTWGYDKAYQLTSQNRTSPLAGSSYVSTLTYDNAGNPTVEKTPTLITTSTYDVANRLLKQKAGANITTYTYDAYGNRVSKRTSAANLTTHTWDYDHRLKQTVLPAGGNVLTYTYNADGLRYGTQTTSTAKTKYIWHGQLLVAETDQTNALQTTYTQGTNGYGDLISRYHIGSSTTDYPLYDALGSLDRTMTEGDGR